MSECNAKEYDHAIAIMLELLRKKVFTACIVSWVRWVEEFCTVKPVCGGEASRYASSPNQKAN